MMTLTRNGNHRRERWSTNQESVVDLVKHKSPDAPTSEPLELQKYEMDIDMVTNSSSPVKFSSLDDLLLEVIQRMAQNTELIQGVVPTRDGECVVGEHSRMQTTDWNKFPSPDNSPPRLNQREVKS